MNMLKYRREGQIAVTIVFFAALAVTLITGLIFLASSFLQISVRSLNKLRAFSIAEAGIRILSLASRARSAGFRGWYGQARVVCP